MPCPFCDVGACINPDHGIVRLYQGQRAQVARAKSLSPELRPVLLYDVRRPSFLPREQLRVQAIPLPQRVTVSAYRDNWEAGSKIVRDANRLHGAWLLQAIEERGWMHCRSTNPPPNKCSGADWSAVDEGMDVAAEIANVDSQLNRAGAGVTLWRASCFGHFDVVGILITQHAFEHGDEAELAIRWLVGHPTRKGAGAALMAKIDLIHRTPKYRNYPLHVTAAASSVKWYASKGFEPTEAAKCNDDDVECGCIDMIKRPPRG